MADEHEAPTVVVLGDAKLIYEDENRFEIFRALLHWSPWFRESDYRVVTTPEGDR